MKCIRTINGTILPIANISIISWSEDLPKVWTNANGDLEDTGYVIEKETYSKLLNELEIL